MPTNTPNRGYKAYDDVADTGVTFLSFRGTTNGTSGTSNISKIDADMQGAYDGITGLAGAGRTTETVYQNSQNILAIKNQTTKQITATSATPNIFSATNADITSYSNGLVILASFDSVNTSSSTVNINTLGAKQLTKIDSTGNAISLSAGDIQINRPILFKYNGTVFVMISGNTADQINISDSGSLITATNVEGALQEIFTKDNEKISKTLITAVNDFVIGTGNGTVAKKTLSETKDILGVTDQTTTLQNLSIGSTSLTLASDADQIPKWDITPRHYINLLGKDGNCEDMSKWSVGSASLALDSTNKVFGYNGLKVTITSTSGYAYKSNVIPDASKYYLISAYVKNGNATNIGIRKDNTGGGNVLNSALVTATSSFTRTGIKCAPADLNVGNSLLVLINGASTQYAYTDGIQINEITASEYTNDSVAVLMDRYPYGDSIVCTANPTVDIVKDNLVRNGSGEEGIGYWDKHMSPSNITSDGTKITMTAAQWNGIKQIVKVKPNTNYYLKANVSAGSDYVSAWASPDGLTLGAYLGTCNSTFNTGNNKYVEILFQNTNAATQTISADSIMLIEGTVAPTAYKTQRRTQTTLEGRFYTGDVLNLEAGQVKGSKLWKERTLYGKDFAMSLVVDYASYKAITVSSLQLGALSDKECVKYDGKILKKDATNTQADSIAIASTTAIYLSISDSDTGWTESVNPNDDEIKAFMNGWKAMNYTGSRYVSWLSVVDGSIPAGAVQTTASGTNNSGQATLNVTDASALSVNDTILINYDNGSWGGYTITGKNANALTVSPNLVSAVGNGKGVMKQDNGSTNISLLTYCKSNVAPGYEGYKLIYKLATPQTIGKGSDDYLVPLKGDVPLLEPGVNTVTYDTGIVRGEVATPKDNGAGYFIIGYNRYGVSAYSPFKYVEESIQKIYKNGVDDTANWSVLSNVYDNCLAQIPSANYDPNATYTVDYTILRTTAPQISTAQLSFKEGITDAINRIADALNTKQNQNVALDNLVDASMYEKIYPTFHPTVWYTGGGALYVRFFVSCLPKNVVPRVKKDTLTILKGYLDATSAFTFENYTYSNGQLSAVYKTVDTTTINDVKANGAMVYAGYTLDCREVV